MNAGAAAAHSSAERRDDRQPPEGPGTSPGRSGAGTADAADSTDVIVAWQCIGSGRIEDPQPRLGVCQDQKVRLVYTKNHEKTLARLRGAGIDGARATDDEAAEIGKRLAVNRARWS
jgi:hypothetical protein